MDPANPGWGGDMNQTLLIFCKILFLTHIFGPFCPEADNFYDNFQIVFFVREVIVEIVGKRTKKIPTFDFHKN